jgi:fibronectin-binding autotransporter adhesin
MPSASSSASASILSGAWSLTPHVQLTYASVRAGSFVDPFGAVVSTSGDSLKGRLGLSADHRSSWRDGMGRLVGLTLYGTADLTYEFLDGTTAKVSGTRFNSREERLWGSAGLGVKYEWDRSALFAEVRAGTSLTGFGDSHVVGGRAGLRLSW